jgi:D-sedoheptulose 7-phosphate isomerase
MPAPDEFVVKGRAVVRDRLEAHQAVVAGLALHADVIAEIAAVVVNALRTGHKILVFGNGGSAADAQHMAAELLGRYRLERSPLPAIALTTDSSTLTAIANDYDYARVFARQLEALGCPGDVAIGLSTSGRSANVLGALRVATKRGMVTVALTGEGGLESDEGVHLCLRVPSRDTARIQEAHITAIHCICELVEQAWVTP